MTADAEIAILIKAQDQFSDKIDGMNKKLDSFVRDNKKQTESLSQSWNRTTDSLIAIGNVASSVDSIFSSLTNLEIRLENATERLANAQDRLADAGGNVEKSQKKLQFINERLERLANAGITTGEQVLKLREEQILASDDLTQAQKEEERATRSLTIAENNLARAQNQVLGTYIQIGIQSVSLAKSLPVLLSSFTGVGGIIILVGSALAGLTYLMRNNEEVGSSLSEISTSLKTIWIEMQPILQELLIAITPIILALLEVLNAGIQLVDFLLPVFIPAIKVVAEFIKYWANEIKSIIELITDLIGWIEKAISSLAKLGGTKSNIAFSAVSAVASSVKSKKVNDFILQPGGKLIETSPDDTIMGMKNPMGGTIIVNIDRIYGTDPREISRALKDELSNKLSL